MKTNENVYISIRHNICTFDWVLGIKSLFNPQKLRFVSLHTNRNQNFSTTSAFKPPLSCLRCIYKPGTDKKKTVFCRRENWQQAQSSFNCSSWLSRSAESERQSIGLALGTCEMQPGMATFHSKLDRYLWWCSKKLQRRNTGQSASDG